MYIDGPEKYGLLYVLYEDVLFELLSTSTFAKKLYLKRRT